MGLVATVAELDRQFGIPNVARVVEGNGGLPKIVITTAAAAGEMYLHGAHVTSWKPTNAEEVLFVSAKSRWDDSHAIRGGIPICFPWFGDKANDPKAPAHGFVRAKSWQLESTAYDGSAATASMFTESDDSTKKWWSADFRLVYRVTFGSELVLELLLANTGNVPLRFEEALHTYHKVGDVTGIRVRGLDGFQYLDKTDSLHEKTQQGDITIDSETDRVYLNTQHPLELDDAVLHRRTRIAKENSSTTVIWNPWIQKAAAMADLGDEEWRQMICIETSNVSGLAVELGPGQQHKMKASIQVAGLSIVQ